MNIVRQGSGGNVIKRRKTHADFYLRKERFAHAIREYEALIEQVDESEHEFLGSVYHNMGIAYARQFLFEQAEEAFPQCVSCVTVTEGISTAMRQQNDASAGARIYPEISSMINYSDDTLRLEEEMRVAVAEWEQSDEFAEFKNMMGTGYRGIPRVGRKASCGVQGRLPQVR